MPHLSTRHSYSTSAHEILQDLCSLPTAPFAEGAVTRYVQAFVKARRRLKLTQDEFGNVLIELSGTSKKSGSNKNPPRLVFTAHMDHPGFVADGMTDARTLEAHFYGGVDAAYFAKSRVIFFEPEGEVRANVIGYQTGDDGRPNRATLRTSRAVAPGTPGMWDQGNGRFVGKRFLSRVCDDLAGAAGALAMLDVLAKKPPSILLAVLLTRAEEEGFIGAIGACLRPTLLRKSDRLIAIECSAAQIFAPQGNGAIIRVGDRTSVFNSALSYFITQVATTLAKKDKRFKYQRALMPGGTCEATVYDIYGYTAASICIALGNYHNMDRGKKKIGPEYINVDDWNNMVSLFIELARRGHEFEPGHKPLKDKIETRFKKFQKRLAGG